MDELTALIEKVDEDYLVGLSNKGTVKRAARDLEKEAPILTWENGEAKVALKEECCILRSPLGDSSCSCPSHSVCRHIITAVLWMKQELAEKNNQEMVETAVTEPFQEILDIPAEKLKRACGSRRYRDFLAHVRAMELPPVMESSIITVTLPWEKAVVKLLIPFDSSACTCHSRELCAHKAQAVLAFQLKKNILTLKELEALQETESSFDEDMVKQAANLTCEALCQQMGTGLSRQSYEEAESLERLAIIAHRAGLPELENGLRTAAAGYQQYFSRSAAFQDKELMENILRVYRLAGMLREAAGKKSDEGKEEIRRLAGVFRDTYELVGKLHLTGMGGRTFSSKAGYEGEIYYFLETEQQKWYTWTDARPTIYEASRRKPPAFSDSASAPWGLNCSRAELQKLKFDLRNAKAASGGRLSVSQESKGEIIGTRSLEDEKIRQMIEWDFEKLLRKYFTGTGNRETGEDAEKGWEEKEGWQRREKPVLVGAVRWGETVFDTVSQRFSWKIFDRQERTLFISLKYTKEERMTIQLLERMEKRLKGNPPDSIVFFGSLYMDEEGRLCLYPIEVFFGEVTGDESIFSPEDEKSTEFGGITREILTSMKQYLQEVERGLLDIFYCGINSLQEEILSGLETLSEDGERLGLHQAGKKLAYLAGLLRGKRHQMEFSAEPVLEIMGELTAYFRACKEKLSCDMALLEMKGD